MSRLPVRNSLKIDLRSRISSNSGLVYTKYADTWADKSAEKDTSFYAGGQEKKSFFESFTKLMELQKGGEGETLLKNLHGRREYLFKNLKAQGWSINDTPVVLTTQWRLVSGLGIAHPFETGLVFDHTYGVPYLPGSSVKGAARAWAEENGDRYPVELRRVIFGPKMEDKRAGLLPFEASRGYVVFFDAYPTKWPELELDIINPHYSEYYNGDSPPADWLSPVPTYFLTVKSNTEWEFVVGVAPVRQDLEEGVFRKAGVDDKGGLLQDAIKAVTGAAQELGMGGKTAVGYGYFEPGNQAGGKEGA